MPTATDLNTWEKLYGQLRATAASESQGGTVSKALEKLHSAAQSNDEVAFQEHVRNLLNTYGKDYGLNQSNANTDSILKESLAWRDEYTMPHHEESSDVSTSETPIQWVADRKEQNWSQGPTEADRANQQLMQDQRKATLDAFEHLVATTDPEDLPAEIEKFYHDHLSAQGVLGNQYKIIQAKVMGLERFRGKDKPKGMDNLEQEADELTTQVGQHPKRDERAADDLSSLHGSIRVKPGEVLSREDRAREARRAAAAIFDRHWRELGGVVRSALSHIEGEVSVRELRQEGFVTAANTVVQQNTFTQEPDMIKPGSAEQEEQLAKAGLGGRVRRGAQRAKNAVKGAYNNFNRLKKAAEYAQAAIDAAGELVATLTSEEWVPALLIALGALLLLIVLAIVVIVAYNLISNNSQQLSSQQQYPSAGIVANAQLISSTLCRENMHVINNPQPWYDPCIFGGGLLDNFNPNWKQLLQLGQPSYSPGQPQSPRPWDGNTFTSPDFAIKIGTWLVHNNPQPNCDSCNPPHIPDSKYWIMWGKFWCTDLVINSYAAAGFKEIFGWYPPPNPWGIHTNWDTGNVDVLILFFMYHKGYQFIFPNQFNPDTIGPGAAIFIKCDKITDSCHIGGHTAIVTAVNQNLGLKQKGILSGTIDYIQANAGSRTAHVSYSQGVIQSNVAGFGIKLAQ